MDRPRRKDNRRRTNLDCRYWAGYSSRRNREDLISALSKTNCTYAGTIAWFFFYTGSGKRSAHCNDSPILNNPPDLRGKYSTQLLTFRLPTHFIGEFSSGLILVLTL